MTDLDGCEQLHLTKDLRDGLQTIQDRVNPSTHQLIVLSRGGLEVETGNPVTVEVHQEMNNLGTQLIIHGMLCANLWLGRTAARFPFQDIHLQTTATIFSRIPATPLHKLIRQLVWILRPGPDIAVEAGRQAPIGLVSPCTRIAPGGQQYLRVF